MGTNKAGKKKHTLKQDRNVKRELELVRERTKARRREEKKRKEEKKKGGGEEG